MPFVSFDPEKRPAVCRSPEHDPPGMIVLQPGVYTWECPACGRRVTFKVDGVYLNSGGKDADKDVRDSW